MIEKVVGEPPVEVRVNSLQPKTQRFGSKFFVKVSSIHTAGVLRVELNGRYLQAHRVALKVSFFGSSALKRHL